MEKRGERRRRELAFPAWEHFAGLDPMPERVMNQILLGVSTRSYEASLEPRPRGVTARGTSKSAVSRQLVKRTCGAMDEQLTRSLADVHLIGLYLDGIQVAQQSVVVALGLSEDGSKIPPGLWRGSTENAVICTELLQNLLKRGLKVEGRLLCVIDGGKGMHKALTDVLGDLALIQRCQVHKLRNVRGHLPKSRHAYVTGSMREAYRSTSVDTARKRLRSLVTWLANNGHDDAAGSLREGLEELFGTPPSSRRAAARLLEHQEGTIDDSSGMDDDAWASMHRRWVPPRKQRRVTSR